VLGLALPAACASWAPGEDASGQQLKQSATPVLVALAAYHRARGEYPSSLYELVPRYLEAVPFRPALNLDLDKQTLEFGYMLPFPRTGDATCTAALGTTEWTCRSR
jgi:hypothetical protein